MPEQHATLSASGASRWMHCTPSALLEAELPGESSEYAEQGTAAHALAEHKLRLKLKMKSKRPKSPWQDDEMEKLTSDYAAHVMRVFKRIAADHPEAEICIEQRLDFSHIVPGGFGTGDAVIVADGVLHVIDLKYGSGVLVSAADNPQLSLYGLGALNEFGMLFERPDVVTLEIFQPRTLSEDPVSKSVISTDLLEEWAEKEVRPKALLAAEGAGEFETGPWCQFCKLRPTCRKMQEETLDLAREEFSLVEPPVLSEAEIAEVLQRGPQLVSWVQAVQKYALAQALDGVEFPGMKVIEGRGKRVYADPELAAKAAEEAGYSGIWDTKLKPLTALEKHMGKADFNAIVGPYIAVQPGAPKLVPQSTPGASLDAKTDFQKIGE